MSLRKAGPGALAGAAARSGVGAFRRSRRTHGRCSHRAPAQETVEGQGARSDPPRARCRLFHRRGLRVERSAPFLAALVECGVMETRALNHHSPAINAVVIASEAKQSRERGAPRDPWIAASLRSSG